MNYAPVCAQDAMGNTQTFGNLCELSQVQCTDSSTDSVQGKLNF